MIKRKYNAEFTFSIRGTILVKHMCNCPNCGYGLRLVPIEKSIRATNSAEAKDRILDKYNSQYFSAVWSRDHALAVEEIE